MRTYVWAVALLGLTTCHRPTAPAPAPLPHSGTMALSSDGETLYVVNPDSDSVSILDTTQKTLVRQVPLGPTPAVDANGDYTPTIAPRALALSPDGTTLFVTGSRSNSLYMVTPATGSVHAVPVASMPTGVLATAHAVYVACSQDAVVLRLDASTGQETARAAVAAKPWALALSQNNTVLVTHLLGPGLTELDAESMAVLDTPAVTDVAPRGDRRLAHGQARGLYAVQARPGSDEVWVAHTLLGTDTPQPQLDFESTAFPALSVLRHGALQATLSTDASDVPGVDGALADVVSGPHAMAFTHDGQDLLVVDAFSEDVLLVDADTQRERSLLRPLPGHLPEGIVLSADDQTVYVDERNSGDVAVLTLQNETLTVTGRIPRWPQDPMPAPLRLGQHLFYSANSDEAPITTDHWIACGTCHMEGGSDAVTWLFAQGPRDTPANAGGVLGTGFLFRTADRSVVQDYWHTVNVEQGGHFDPNAQMPQMNAIAAFVNHALPLPPAPTLDANTVAAGRAVFMRSDVGCSSCHSGPWYTDSGAGNPNLDLAGPVLLHDVGTCVQSGAHPDVAHADVQGNPREGCQFDTPTLRGLAASAPYMHDGSAATLEDVLQRGGVHSPALSVDEAHALTTFLLSL